MSIKNSFSIKDLENLSGVKAHTIRIWEKRYNLLSPERTQTNIRRYSLLSLQKLLNITLNVISIQTVESWHCVDHFSQNVELLSP